MAIEENGLGRKEALTCPRRYNLRNEEEMCDWGHTDMHTCTQTDTHALAISYLKKFLNGF